MLDRRYAYLMPFQPSRFRFSCVASLRKRVSCCVHERVLFSVPCVLCLHSCVVVHECSVHGNSSRSRHIHQPATSQHSSKTNAKLTMCCSPWDRRQRSRPPRAKSTHDTDRTPPYRHRRYHCGMDRIVVCTSFSDGRAAGLQFDHRSITAMTPLRPPWYVPSKAVLQVTTTRSAGASKAVKHCRGDPR